MKLHKLKLGLLVVAITLYGCSGSQTSVSNSGGGENPQVLTLNIDQMSQVPLVNGSPQNFYMYATNYGKTQLSNLSWNAKLQDASTSTNKTGSVADIKSRLKQIWIQKSVNPKDTSSAITIINAGECATIAAGNTCKIELKANQAGVALLSAKSNGQDVTLEGGGGLTQAGNYPTIYTGNAADTLSLSPISAVSYGGSGGSYNFYIINNGILPVSLTASSVGSLPANVTLVLGNCPNPVPSGGACQARLVFTNPSGSTTQELSIPLTLSGNVLNPDGSTTPLPAQNGDTTLKATTATIGIIQRIISQNLTVDASTGKALPTSGIGIISNVGTGLLTISDISSPSKLVRISNDNCSGKTLGQGETCNYLSTLDVSNITSSGSAAVNITYDNSVLTGQSTSSLINWTYITPSVAQPAINLSVSPSNLNQITTLATVTLNNNGNVPLSNLTPPIFTPANPRVLISATTCSSSLAVNASCTYSITYTPTAPSETTSVILSGISANYPNNLGGNSSITFNNSSAINLSSIFAGSLTISGNLNLNNNVSSGIINVSNNGNATATISSITMDGTSSPNLVLNGGTCTNTTTLNPNQSCTVGIKLNNTLLSGSGNGTVVISYDNHNGTPNATSSNSNIAWLIGNAPSLNISFANNSLSTIVTVESTTVLTLSNNGKDNLTNIVLPILSESSLSFRAAHVNSCSLTNQSLNVGSSCDLILAYTPTIAQANKTTTLGSFSATYSSNSTYTSSPYNITLSAITPSAISVSPSSVSQSANWVDPTASSNVTLHNDGQATATITNITSNDPAITTTGCINTSIISGSDCILSINSNYSTSLNGVITISYNDASSTNTQIINVSGSYTNKPIITPNLTMIATSLFNQSISQEIQTISTPYVVNLTNNSTATNNGAVNISIPYASLLPTDDTATYSINTTGISNNPCALPTPGNTMTLNSGENCSYNLIISTGNTAQSSSTRSITTNYNYNLYNDNSITPTLTGNAVLSNSFNLAQTLNLAQLSIINTSQSTNFNSIEQGISPNPTMNVIIINTGGTAVNGSISAANLPPAISGDFSNCTNLGANESCSATLTMATTNLITASNLNLNSISYNNGYLNVSANFPSISYSVVTPLAPTLTMTESVTGCASGNGTSNGCMNNPDNNGGTASSIQVILKFTNRGTVAASSLSLPAASESTFTSS